MLQCLHKGPGIRTWFPLFSLFFTQKSLSPHWIVFYLKSSKQDFNVCKHWLQILSIIWVPCSLQPPRAKLTSKISPPINHVNQTPLFISIQVYLPISGNQFIRWLIRHYIPTICYTAQLINVATAPTYLECYANCIARVSSVTKAFLQFFMSTLYSSNWENFEKKHFINYRNTLLSNQYPCFAPLIIKRLAPQGCTPFQIFRYFYRHLYVLLTRKRNWEEKKQYLGIAWLSSSWCWFHGITRVYYTHYTHRHWVYTTGCRILWGRLLATKYP